MKKLICSAIVAAALAALSATASAVVMTVEPDSYAAGTLIGSAYPGVTLSVDGKPASDVQALDGFSAFNGRNLATTGTSVFGQSPIHSLLVPQGWDEFNGLLRADFHNSTDFVEVDIIFDDDDFGRLRAFDSGGALLESIFVSGDGRNPIGFATATISRSTNDIAYILVGGDLGEAVFLDNLMFNQIPDPTPVTEPTAIALLAFGMIGIGAAARRRST
jgi:hypothetical protein